MVRVRVKEEKTGRVLGDGEVDTRILPGEGSFVCINDGGIRSLRRVKARKDKSEKEIELTV